MAAVIAAAAWQRLDTGGYKSLEHGKHDVPATEDDRVKQVPQTVGPPHRIRLCLYQSQQPIDLMAEPLESAVHDQQLDGL